MNYQPELISNLALIPHFCETMRSRYGERSPGLGWWEHV